VITPTLLNQVLTHEENSLSDDKKKEAMLAAIAWISLRGDTVPLSPTDFQFAASKLTGVISKDGTYVPQLNALTQLIAGKVAGLLPEDVPQLNALTTKNEGNKFHVMSIKNFLNALENPIVREAVRASYQIVSKDDSDNHYTFFKLNKENIRENSDGYISFIDPITGEIVRSDDDKQILIGPALQNTQQYTNQLTTGSILSDSEKQEIKNDLSKQLQLKYPAEEPQEQVQSLAVDNKYTYIGNYPNGEGVLTNNENGDIYTLIWKEGNLTTIQTPEYFGNIKDYSKFRIEKINNEYYFTYNGNLLVVVNSKEFDENQLKNIDRKFVENFQRDYLGKNPKTVEEIGKQFNHNLERSRLDMAGEIVGNTMALVGIAALSVAAAGFIAPTSFGVAGALPFYATKSAVTAANIVYDVSTQQFLMYSMNLTYLWVGVGASGISGLVSATMGTFGTTFDYIFLKYKKDYICVPNKQYCEKVKKGEQDVVINQCIIRLRENVLKLILVFNDFLSDSYKLYNDKERSMFSLVSSYKDPLDNSIKFFIANYCSSDCSELMNTLQELLSSNPNLKILNKLIQFYQYNDVNFNKGVFDWIFLLNDVINVFFENNNDQIKYVDTTFNPMSKDGINLYEQLYNSDFSFIEDIKENNERVKYITKSMLQESIVKYIDDRKSDSEPPTFTVNEIFSVKYENIEKLFKNILILNKIVVHPETYDSINARAYIFLQYKTILQYFNFGPYQIVNETQTKATVIDIRTTPPKTEVKKLDLVDEFVAYSNMKSEHSEIFSPMVFLDVYQFKLLEQDKKYLELFSAKHYDTQSPYVQDIKKQYQKSITYVNNNPLQDMYILLSFVNAKSINKKDGDFSHFPFMTAQLGKNSDYAIRLLKIEKIVHTNNIYQYVNDADFYIPLLNFYDSNNIKYLKDFNRYITRHVNYLKLSDPKNNTYSDFKPEIDMLTNKFPFEMELDVYSLRTLYWNVFNLSSYDENAIEEGKLPKGKKKSILINSEILNDLCENYTSYLKQIKKVVDNQLSTLNSFSKRIQQRDEKFADYFISFVRKTTNTRIPENIGKTAEFQITFTDATDLFIFKKVISDIPLQQYICFSYKCTLFSVNEVFKQNNFFITYDKSNKNNPNEIVNLQLNNLRTIANFEYVNSLSVNSISFHNVDIDNLINMTFYREYSRNDKIDKKLNILSSSSDKSKDIKITMQLNQISLCKYLNFNLIVYNFPSKDELSIDAKPYVERNISQGQIYSSIFTAGKQIFKLPFRYLYINKEIYSKDNFIRNYKALQRSYTYTDYDKRIYKFQNIDEIIKPTENGWFFKAFHTYNQTTDDLHYIDRTYVFLPESVVDTLIEQNA
jgi:hypothetical protein